MHQIPFQPDFGAASASATALFAKAEQAGRRFTERGSPDAVPSLVHSWASSVEHILIAAQAQLPLRGKRFCEWGCGIGAVACLAAQQGWTASGFDIEPALVTEAQRFAAGAGCEVRYSVSSYFDPDPDQPNPFDCDLIFVYPWPAEVQRVLSRFEEAAPPGVVLIVHEGAFNVRAFSNGADPKSV